MERQTIGQGVPKGPVTKDATVTAVNATATTSATATTKKHIVRHDEFSRSLNTKNASHQSVNTFLRKRSDFTEINEKLPEKKMKTIYEVDRVKCVEYPVDDHDVTVYMVMALDNSQFLDANYRKTFTETWSTDHLDRSFIHSVESMTNLYQQYMSQILSIMHKLQKLDEGKFRVIGHKNELRVYFPTSLVRSKLEAIQLLMELGVRYNPSLFKIIEDHPFFFSNNKAPLPDQKTEESHFYEELDNFFSEIDSFSTSSRPSFAF